MMEEKLIRAIWESGWRAGHECGIDDATAFEHGHHSSMPKRASDAWVYYVSNRPATIEGWDDIP